MLRIWKSLLPRAQVITLESSGICTLINLVLLFTLATGWEVSITTLVQIIKEVDNKQIKVAIS